MWRCGIFPHLSWIWISPFVGKHYRSLCSIHLKFACNNVAVTKDTLQITLRLHTKHDCATEMMISIFISKIVQNHLNYVRDKIRVWYWITHSLQIRSSWIVKTISVARSTAGAKQSKRCDFHAMRKWPNRIRTQRIIESAFILMHGLWMRARCRLRAPTTQWHSLYRTQQTHREIVDWEYTHKYIHKH